MIEYLMNKRRAGGAEAKGERRLALLSLTALGVVYGDIGTSPLYALRECFFGKYAVAVSSPNVLGVLSLITWSLVIVISIKYLALVLRADNDGEGGILALMELVKRPVKGISRKLIMAGGLFGAALLYGDGMITPAISVLSAIEGLQVATPLFRPYILPLTILILIGLFGLQKLGTGGVGKLFGPLMLVWFAVLAAAGTMHIARHPEVLLALNPSYGTAFFIHNGFQGLTIMGIVFLVVTGGEALYADIGHFGTAPIRMSWYAVVLPSLLLNYFGQGALLLGATEEFTNPFYQMVPSWALYPMVGLATVATIIASQAIISGAFSLTFQAFHLGYLPRLNIHHTSREQRGQIYVPMVNWILLMATIGLVLGFRHSSNLAAAYGVAISATMVMTTLLFFLVMRKVFRWPLRRVLGLTSAFLLIDLVYFVANMMKIIDGGWFPILIAGLIFLLMATWRKGYAIERRKSRNRILSVREFLADIGGGGKYRRVPGQAVYLTSNTRGTPHALMHNLKHNRALHNTVIIYTATFVKAPHVVDEKRYKVEKLRADIHRVVAYYGFMESPDVPRDLAMANKCAGLGLDLEKVTYFIGGEILTAKQDIGMSQWRAWLYTLMARNETRATHFFNLPLHQVFEIGKQIPV